MPMSKGLRTLYQAVQLFRDLDPEVPAQQVCCFLLIANADEDVQMRDLETQLGTSSASASRNVAALSAHHRVGKAGMNLVEAYEDLNDRRYKRVRLTAKGKAFKARLITTMG